jgi:hypothetical protein
MSRCCDKTVSNSGQSEISVSNAVLGNALVGGNLTVSGETKMDGFIDGGANEIFKTEADMPILVGGKHILAANKSYLFDGAFVLANPISFSGAAGESVEIKSNGYIAFVGAGTNMFDLATVPDIDIKLEGVFADGVGNTNTCFNLTSAAGGTTISFQRCTFVAWADIGLLSGFTAVTIANSSFTLGTQGITLHNTNLVGISIFATFGMLNAVGTRFIECTGTLGGIGLSTCTFSTGSNEYALFIVNTATPLASITASASTIAGRFFDPVGLDQTSIYVNAQSNRNIRASVISGQINLAVASTTTIDATDAITIADLTGLSTYALERVTASVAEHFQYIGFETSLIMVELSMSAEPSAGVNKVLNTQFAVVKDALRTVTFTNATNLINEVSTPRANGDLISFKHTAGTLPAELKTDIMYYVVSKLADSFQVSYTLGGAAIAFTDDGTPVNSYSEAQMIGVAGTAQIDSGSPQQISTKSLFDWTQNDHIMICVSNSTDSSNVQINSMIAVLTQI